MDELWLYEALASFFFLSGMHQKSLWTLHDTHVIRISYNYFLFKIKLHLKQLLQYHTI